MEELAYVEPLRQCGRPFEIRVSTLSNTTTSLTGKLKPPGLLHLLAAVQPRRSQRLGAEGIGASLPNLTSFETSKQCPLKRFVLCVDGEPKPFTPRAISRFSSRSSSCLVSDDHSPLYALTGRLATVREHYEVVSSRLELQN